MIVVNAEKSDAPLIAEVVIAAVGEDIARSLARGNDLEAVKVLFTRLAARDDSQYSYRNALKALDSDGTPMGFVVAYDGASLHPLRRALFDNSVIWPAPTVRPPSRIAKRRPTLHATG